MPRIYRKSKRRTAAVADTPANQMLLRGVTKARARDGTTCPFGADKKAIRRAWEANREALLEYWIAQRPGTRPWAWWQFEAPERRQRADGGLHPFDRPERAAEVEEMAKRFPWAADRAWRLRRGVPAYRLLGELAIEFETETAYLQRLGLLTDYEQERLSK